jgi:hypothetical protein
MSEQETNPFNKLTVTQITGDGLYALRSDGVIFGLLVDENGHPVGWLEFPPVPGTTHDTSRHRAQLPRRRHSTE